MEDLRQKIEQIVNSNCEEIPYEGTEVNKNSMINELVYLFDKPVVETWDDIYNIFKNKEDELKVRDNLIRWLKTNYNPPTKK